MPTPDVFGEGLSKAQETLRTGDWAGAVEQYVTLAESFPGRPEAVQRLGNLLAEARNNPARVTPENFAQLKPALERAAQLGTVPAMLLLGQNLRPYDPEEALVWYEKAAEKGNTDAMVQAGLLRGNHHSPEENRKALELFIQAADAGNRDGKYCAGECYYFSKPGLVPNEEKALEYLHDAAALGELKSMNLLGLYYRKAHRYEEARRFLEEGARGGLPLAMANLGVLYMNGEGVTSNPEAAAELFRQAAEKGDPGGMYLYGQCFYSGKGTPRDVRQANEWFKRSAKAGNPAAIKFCKDNKLDFQ